MSSIIKDENINKIDFLIIDVEGLEFNILYEFLTNTNLKPNIIFEMKFMKKDQIFKILDLLKNYEYDITLFKNDFIRSKVKKILKNIKIFIVENTWRFDDNVVNVFDKHVKQSIPHYENLQNYLGIAEWYLKDNSLIYDLAVPSNYSYKII